MFTSNLLMTVTRNCVPLQLCYRSLCISQLARSISKTSSETKRHGKKKRLGEDNLERKGFKSVVALSTADEYDLEKLTQNFKKYNIFAATTLSKDLKCPDFLHATVIQSNNNGNDDPRELFIFREGSFVAWNVSDMDVEVLLGLLRKVAQGNYDDSLIRDESELMCYQKGESTKICEDDVIVKSGDDEVLNKFAVSNAMALSVKLGTWEALLSSYINSMEEVTAELKRGTKIKMSQAEVLKRTGELFALRHAINLRSDLLDTPDFYWDREHLEAVYLHTISYFCIGRRTRVINEKINHCLELVQLLSSRLSDNHHVRLEWMIIVLIMVEVGFEALHYVERLT